MNHFLCIRFECSVTKPKLYLNTWYILGFFIEMPEKFEQRFVLFAAAFYTPFFKEVWERKGEIERAFRLEQPHNLPDVATARQPYHSYLNHK